MIGWRHKMKLLATATVVLLVPTGRLKAKWIETFTEFPRISFRHLKLSIYFASKLFIFANATKQKSVSFYDLFLFSCSFFDRARQIWPYHLTQIFMNEFRLCRRFRSFRNAQRLTIKKLVRDEMRRAIKACATRS